MKGAEGEIEPGRAEALFERARALLAILRSQARRAYVLELTGTPKAGKTTSVSALQTFFKEAGYQVHLLKERAADCPLPMKGHFFFNAWTTSTMLAEVLETHETNVDILILDRGFFDALVWLELQARRNQVSIDEKRIFSEFVLLDRWRSLVDVTIVMSVEPNVALLREHQSQIIKRVGSMMREESLATFNEALRDVRSQYDNLFSIIEIDTTAHTSSVATNISLLEHLLPRLDDWADPFIRVVPANVVSQVFAGKPFIHGVDAQPALNRLEGSAISLRRSEAEKSLELVQIVAAGVHTHRNGILVLERDPQDRKASEYGRRTLWVGCHVEAGEDKLLQAAESALEERIRQDLHLWNQPRLDFLGLAWDRDHQDAQHMGVIFRAPVESDYVASHLRDKQFKTMGRAMRLRSLFMTQQEIVTQIDDLSLESWSKHIAKNIRLSPPPSDERNHETL